MACEPTLSDTPPASCLPVGDNVKSCNGPTQFDYGEQQRRCFAAIEVEHQLLDHRECPPFPSNTPGDPNAKIDISSNFIPHNLNYFNLSISLRIPDSSNVEYYEVLLEYDYDAVRVSRGFDCVVIDEPQHNFTLRYKRKSNQDVKIRVTVRTSPIDLYSKLIGLKAPQFCADTGLNMPYDSCTCGLPRLEMPTNIALQCNATHTTMSWDPAYYIKPGSNDHIVPDEVSYYLTLTTCDGKILYFTIDNTTAVTLNVSQYFEFKLYAYSPCSGLYQYVMNQLSTVLGCSWPARCTDSSINSCCVASAPSVCPSPSPSVRTTDPTDSSHDYHLTVTVIAVALAILIIITVLIVVVVILKCRRGGTREEMYVRVCRQNSPSPPCEFSALVIYSSSTPDPEQHVIMEKLGPYVYDLIGSYLQRTRRPKQTLIDWITEHHEKANVVFCVCNAEFYRDWENDGTRQYSTDGSVAVRTLRHIYEGDLKTGPESVYKYAVVLAKPTDEVFIPAILRKQHKFDLSDTASLVNFARHQPPPAQS